MDIKCLHVASFTDAWIETYFCSREQYLKTSHLLQMRGLKLIRCAISRVASMSHLLQMRGLKHIAFAQKLNPGESHLLQMRGLKR